MGKKLKKKKQGSLHLLAEKEENEAQGFNLKNCHPSMYNRGEKYSRTLKIGATNLLQETFQNIVSTIMSVYLWNNRRHMLFVHIIADAVEEMI